MKAKTPKVTAAFLTTALADIADNGGYLFTGPHNLSACCG